jgi:uncharacterized delta-60 repeat protein
MKRSVRSLVFCCFQFLTITTFAQVSPEWVQRYTAEGYTTESANDMVVDAQGNVYITGSQKTGSNQSEAVTLKYDAQGVLQWNKIYHAPADNGAMGRAVHVDIDGNVYITGENATYSGGNNEMLVIKYNPAGDQLWANRFQYSIGNYNGGYDLTTDATGNVYVTGEYYTGTTYYNIFLVKYDLSGNVINQVFYNQASEGARKIGLGSDGKIIIGGYISDSDSSSFIALKYEQNLDFVWAARWGQGVSNQNVIDMAIDNNNNIILAGTSNLDYAVLKINTDGSVDWGKTYASPEGWDYGRAVVADSSGNIYITGETGTLGYPLSQKITTIKYSAGGDQQWVRRYHGGSQPDGYSGYNIAIDADASVYVIGQTYGTSDIATIKYNTAGSFQWAKTYNGPSNSADNSVAVAVDQNGNTYSAGNSYDNTSFYDIVLIKYAPQSEFSAQFNNHALNMSINGNQVTRDTITVDYTTPVEYRIADVNVTIDSVIHSNDSDLDFVLQHNGITDTLIKQAMLSGENFIGTILNDSATTDLGNGTAPYTGSFRPDSPLFAFVAKTVNGDWVLSIINHASGSTGILKAWSLHFFLTTTNTTDLTELPASTNLLLEQNFPNPFSDITSILFTLPQAGLIDMSIYDITGRIVSVLANGYYKSGTSAITWKADYKAHQRVSPGIYLCRLKAGGSVKSIRIAVQ